jgi:hypothetical protein
MESRNLEYKLWKKRHRWLGNARLVAAGLSLLGLWWIESTIPSFTWWAVGLLVAAFLASSKIFSRIEDSRRSAGLAMILYATPVTGESRKVASSKSDDLALPEQHPYARDVDLTEEGGLLDFLDLTSTRDGLLILANMLAKPASREAIIERQAAVKELKAQLDLREKLFVEGAKKLPYIRTDILKTWAEMEPVAAPKWLPASCFALSALFVVQAVLLALSPTPAGYLTLASILLGELVLWKFGQRYMTMQVVTSEGIHHDCSELRSLVKVVETQQFESRNLQELSGKLRHDGHSASQLLSGFCRLISLFEARRNQIVAMFGPLVLYQTQTALALERWRKKHAHRLPAWIDAIGGFEAYSSLSCFAFEHPLYSFPVLVEDGPVLKAEGLAHPLLAEQAVANDVSLDKDHPVLVVSGANMAGKSTLLRTIGTSVALTYAGAPVRARSMTISATDVVASIRVKDSLQRGESRFAAELSRIRLVLESIRAGRPTLVLIDELFAGTNSYDRYAGAVVLAEFLLGCESSLAVLSTHDRNVTQWAERGPEQVTNVHFRDVFSDGEMRFDYKLHDGPAMRGNAIELMKQAGMPMPESIPSPEA